MNQTIVEKILSAHAGKKVFAGNAVSCKVDLCFSSDAGASAVMAAAGHIADFKLKSKYALFIDHASPAPAVEPAAVHAKMRVFAAAKKAGLCDIGCGISHQVIVESKMVKPGALVLANDPHALTVGALSAVGINVTADKLAATINTGEYSLVVPATVKISITGKLSRGVEIKDAMLYIIGQLKIDAARDKAIEFSGDTVMALSLDEKFTLINMAASLGALCALIAPDYDCVYEKSYEFDVSKLVPYVAAPHSVDNAAKVSDVAGKPVTEAFIGTCANGRLGDLAIAAKILKGKKVNTNVKLLIAPASRDIYLAALKKGYIKAFIDAGAMVVSPGCGPCMGAHQGVLADGEVAITTGNANYQGVMGNKNSSVYLASVATVAASAISGKITDPRKLIKK